MPVDEVLHLVPDAAQDVPLRGFAVALVHEFFRRSELRLPKPASTPPRVVTLPTPGLCAVFLSSRFPPAAGSGRGLGALPGMA